MPHDGLQLLILRQQGLVEGALCLRPQQLVVGHESLKAVRARFVVFEIRRHHRLDVQLIGLSEAEI